MKKYIIATIGLSGSLLIVAYLIFLFGYYFSGEDALSNCIFACGYVSLVLALIFFMSWGNLSTFEDYQRHLNKKKFLGLKLGTVFISSSLLLMFIASFT